MEAPTTEVGGEILGGGGEIGSSIEEASISNAPTIGHLKVSSQEAVTGKTDTIMMIGADRPGGPEGVLVQEGFRCQRPRGKSTSQKRILVTSPKHLFGMTNLWQIVMLGLTLVYICLISPQINSLPSIISIVKK